MPSPPILVKPTVRRHGDLLAIYSQLNDERALVLLTAHRKTRGRLIVGVNRFHERGREPIKLIWANRCIDVRLSCDSL